jgi:hypothetical protein
MASITFTSTAAQDEALIAYVAIYNRDKRITDPAWVDLTPVQFVKQIVLGDKLDNILREYQSATSVTKAAAYKAASTADKAAVDAILAKYQ